MVRAGAEGEGAVWGEALADPADAGSHRLCRPSEVSAGGRDLRRIDDDRPKGSVERGVVQGAEEIAADPARPLAHLVELGVGLGEGEDRGALVEADRVDASVGRVDREAADVTAEVEQGTAMVCRELGDEPPVLPLIEVGAGLLARRRWYAKAEAVLYELERRGLGERRSVGAIEGERGGGEALTLSGGARVEDEEASMDMCFEAGDDRRLASGHRRRRDLENPVVAVAIGDQAREAIALGVDHPDAGGRRPFFPRLPGLSAEPAGPPEIDAEAQRGSAAERRRDPALEPVVGRRRGTKAEEADDDVRLGRVEPPGEGRAAVVGDAGEGRGIGGTPLLADGAATDPGAVARTEAGVLAAELDSYGHARHRTWPRSICYRPRMNAVIPLAERGEGPGHARGVSVGQAAKGGRAWARRSAWRGCGLGLALAVGLCSLLMGSEVLASGAAARRNPVLQRSIRTPVFGVAALARLGVLAGNGGVFVQPPIGYGFALDLRYHALAIANSRLGFQFTAGHDRYQDRRVFSYVDESGEAQEVTRFTTLGHTDISLGPSLQIPIRVLFLEAGVSGGLAVSVFRRPRNVDPGDDDEVVGYEPLLRGDLALGVPIRNNQGIRLGVDVVKIWSPEKNWVVTDVDAPVDTPPDAPVFDLYLDVLLAYQAWF